MDNKMNGPTPRAEGGSLLIETMIALLIFLVGTLALVSLHGNAVREVSEAKYRAEAAFLANKVTAEMWGNLPNLAAYAYGGTGVPPPVLADWMQLVERALPGVSAAANRPTISIASGNTVTVTMRWSPPAEGGLVHSHRLVTQIVGR